MDNEEKILELLAEVLTEQKNTNKRLDSIEHRVTKLEIAQENTIIPGIQLLAEGQKTIQNQIKHISVIDSMQDDIATLKSAVKFLSQEIDKLQKAM